VERSDNRVQRAGYASSLLKSKENYMIYEIGTTTGSISDLIAASRKHLSTGHYLTFDIENNKSAILKVAADLIAACNSEGVKHAILLFSESDEPCDGCDSAPVDCVGAADCERLKA
jgi:hypothetical protein